MPPYPKKRPSRRSSKHGIANGYRSGLEEEIAASLEFASTPFAFEPVKIPFIQPEKKRTYTADFVLLDNYLIIETKGRFLTADRQKHLWLRDQYPELELRFVFSNANQRISKTSKTRHRDWCDKYGFQWAHRVIPGGWSIEPTFQFNKTFVKKLLMQQKGK